MSYTTKSDKVILLQEGATPSLAYYFEVYKMLTSGLKMEPLPATVLMAAHAVREYKDMMEEYLSSDRARTDHPLFGETLSSLSDSLNNIAEAISERK